MGVDYYSYAIIGVKIDPDRLVLKQTVKAFDHDYPETMNFDPQTGKQLWEEEELPIQGFDESEETMCEYPIRYGTDRTTAYIGFVLAEAANREWGRNQYPMAKINLSSLEEEKAKLKQALEPVGLWDEDSFGLWSVLRCRY